MTVQLIGDGTVIVAEQVLVQFTSLASLTVIVWNPSATLKKVSSVWNAPPSILYSKVPLPPNPVAVMIPRSVLQVGSIEEIEHEIPKGESKSTIHCPTHPLTSLVYTVYEPGPRLLKILEDWKVILSRL